jgi:hypothetical protein|tara:strand:- start:42 stop:518 length:477 start_codon:yes stop_codon:yes gene_type:complete
MKKVSLDVLIQLIGLMSVLGGLVFVGLQMQQSQTIALAAQQQARMQVFVEAFSTLSERNTDVTEYLANGIAPENELSLKNFMNQRWMIYENDYFQYRLGLMDEDMWKAKFNSMEGLYNGTNSKDCVLAHYVYDAMKIGFDRNFVELVESIPSDCPSAL